MKNRFFILYFILSNCFFLFQSRLVFSEGNKLGSIESNGIYFEFGNRIDWKKSKLTLSNREGKEITTVFLTELPERRIEGKRLEETDLGGTPKKKAPLAHKNPKFRPTQITQTENPFKKNRILLFKTTEEVTAEGDKVTTSLYADGSKSILKISSASKEESAFNKKGDQVWYHQEGEKFGIRYQITQWEDESIIRDYSKPEGTLSTLYDSEKNNLTFSFLNSNRELIKEIVCTQEGCE